MRVRPKLMTVMADMIGLYANSFSNRCRQRCNETHYHSLCVRIITSTLFVLIVLPVVYQMVKEREVRKYGKVEYLEIKD
jgi:Cu(I)/Ag(I) efflux system membrane protein CusA/SilA